MSFPFEKQPGEKPVSTSPDSDDLTDWDRLKLMDDEDIIFDADNPEIQPGELEQGVISITGRIPTKDEVAEAKRQILEYINRAKRAK